MNMDCMFSGDTPNNSEHIIPQWLQRRFSLQDETLYIPNGSRLKYKFAKIPVKDEHNCEFSKIEKNISEGIFDRSEIYLWALKIHIGMLYRDSSLKEDIKIPTSSMILDINDFGSEVAFFRMLYNIWRNGGVTDPEPFGSVFILDSLMNDSDFDFINCFATGTVCLNIGDKFITVFLWDQTDAYHSNIESTWEKYHKPRVEAIIDAQERSENGYLAQHVWACENSYWLLRNRRSFNLTKTERKLTIIPPLSRSPTREMNEKEYRDICRSFGLYLNKYNGETGNMYSQFDIDKYMDNQSHKKT